MKLNNIHCLNILCNAINSIDLRLKELQVRLLKLNLAYKNSNILKITSAGASKFIQLTFFVKNILKKCFSRMLKHMTKKKALSFKDVKYRKVTRTYTHTIHRYMEKN